jgi:hypothetical protein
VASAEAGLLAARRILCFRQELITLGPEEGYETFQRKAA